MKFCTKCGAVIDDSCVSCPNCGSSCNEKVTDGRLKSNESIGTANAPTSFNEATKAVFQIFSGLNLLLTIAGMILLGIGVYQEVMFRSDYNLTDLSDAGIKLVRSLSDYSNSIKLITAGGICTGIGLLLYIVMFPYLAMLTKKGDQ